MVDLCNKLGLDLNEVMQAKPYWVYVWDYAEEEMMTFYEN